MNRLWRVTVCGAMLLSLGDLSTQPGSAASPPVDWPQALVELRLPADLAPVIVSSRELRVRHDDAGRTRLSGNVRLQFAGTNSSAASVWLHAPQSRAQVSPRAQQPGSGTLVRVEPSADAGIELVVPAGVKVGLEGAALFFDAADTTLRIAGPATLRLSNGIRLLAQDTRLTLIERTPSGDRRIVIEPFTPRPRKGE